MNLSPVPPFHIPLYWQPCYSIAIIARVLHAGTILTPIVCICHIFSARALSAGVCLRKRSVPCLASGISPISTCRVHAYTFSRLCLYRRRRRSCRLGTAPLPVSSARLLELTQIHMVVVAIQCLIPISFSVYILHGLFLPWFSIHNHLAWTFSHFIASLSDRACIAFSARVFPFLFIRGATCTMITILYRPSFFAFFYMYFHYRRRLFVPWRDSRRVTRG